MFTLNCEVDEYHIFYLQQAIPFCGPEQEGCVGNQTLKDESCLVPCTGLYADIADDSRVQQIMMKGI